MLLVNEEVMIDESHASLIYGLVASSKPESVLEFGLGGGRSTRSALDAIRYNHNQPKYTLVDNWMDYGGIKPDLFAYECSGIDFITSDEKDFVLNCQNKYDFIISDADHHHSHEWFIDTYGLLNECGIMVCHDVTNSDFPNLRRILYQCEAWHIKSVLFNKSSRSDERCGRGLLVVFK